MSSEYNQGYKAGQKNAIRAFDILSMYPYNIIEEAEGDADYDITPAEIKKCMANHLTDKESQVLEMRFRQHLTLEEVGASFGVTKERTRQIQSRALRKLRHYLKGYQVIPLRQYTDAVHRYEVLELQYAALAKKYEDKYETPAPAPVTNVTPIETLGLSARPYNGLKRSKYDYVEQLRDVSVDDLMRIRNLGKGSVKEILTKLGRLEEIKLL
jgi:hypothetical protein